MQQRQVALLFSFSNYVLIILTSTVAHPTADSPISPTTITKGASITKPGCPNQCGNLTVPYPFGIGSDCAIDSTFEINCTTTTTTPTGQQATLYASNIKVYSISDTEIRVSTTMYQRCYSPKGELLVENPTWWRFGGSTPYSFSALNMFTVIGCDESAIMTGDNFRNGCFSFCTNSSSTGSTRVVEGRCMGTGCCQIEIPKGLKYFNTTMESVENHTTIWPFNRCGYAFLGEASRFQFRGEEDLTDEHLTTRILNHVPIVLDWAIGNLTCDEAQKSEGYACLANSDCVDSGTGLGGYRCNCEKGYEGNPYITPGCTDINECENTTKLCEQDCKNTPGSYYCSCRKGYTDDGDKDGRVCIPNSEFPWIKFSVGIGVGFISLVVAIILLYFGYNKRKLIKNREKFFQQNGGLLLKQQISSKKGGVEATKIFTAEELKKATNNYASDRILGRGGNGIVYKGILPDNRVVAIKKSKFVDENQIEQFINEVLILTQVNHRNVVRLFGCCLEAEVPLLVYEYVSNGTLYEHIHDQINGARCLSLKDRLRIAAETASSLAYLHSSASMPIIHRDVKSTNILLDDVYTAKVADFGASRLVPLEQTRVATLVQGTLGYLDPEYFHTGELTEKSDVYSFGVVLAELLTGMKPLLRDRSSDKDKCLVEYFVSSMNKNCLFQILDRRVVREGGLEQLQKIAELVKSCLHLHGEDRPTMKEVSMELESLRKFTSLWTNNEHGHKDQNNEVELTDLYAISTDSNTGIDNFSGQYYPSSYTNSSIFSGQYSDVSVLLQNTNLPR